MSTKDGIYKRPDSPWYWITWIDAQGRRQRRAVKVRYRKQAEAARRAEMERVEKQKALGFAPPAEDSFKLVAARFLAHQQARVSPREYDRQKLIVDQHLKPFFDWKLAAIRKADVQQYVTKRAIEVQAGTVQKELNVLKRLLSLAVDEWELIPTNPAHKVKAPRVAAGRTRYLQPTEFAVVISECPDWLRPIAALAVCTGMRRGELLGIRWLDVDLPNARVMLPQTKNGDGRIVYLNDTAKTVIRSLPFGASTRPTDPLFPGVEPEQVSMSFHRACKRANIEDFRFHDCRHTAASWLRMKGADIHTVAQLLGHKDLRMAARYQHLSPAYLSDAVKGLDAVFGNACHDSVTRTKSLPEAVTVNV